MSQCDKTKAVHLHCLVGHSLRELLSSAYTVNINLVGDFHTLVSFFPISFEMQCKPE